MTTKCTDCGDKMTKNDLKYNDDVCQSCVSGYTEDADREMLGDDYDYFETSGYFETNGHFGDK